MKSTVYDKCSVDSTVKSTDTLFQPTALDMESIVSVMESCGLFWTPVDCMMPSNGFGLNPVDDSALSIGFMIKPVEIIVHPFGSMVQTVDIATKLTGKGGQIPVCRLFTGIVPAGRCPLFQGQIQDPCKTGAPVSAPARNA